MPHLFILRFWLGVQEEHCKNSPCSEFCHCTFQRCLTNSYIDYFCPSSLIDVLLEITDCLLSSCCLIMPSFVHHNWKPHLFKQVSHISYVFWKGSKWGWMNCFTARLLTARCSSCKDSLHGAEKKALLLGQLYVGPNSLWEPFVTVIVQLMHCLVLCCGFAGMHLKNILGVCPTKIYMLKLPLTPMPPKVVSSWLDVLWVVDHSWYTWETVECEKPSRVSVPGTYQWCKKYPIVILE